MCTRDHNQCVNAMVMCVCKRMLMVWCFRAIIFEKIFILFLLKTVHEKFVLLTETVRNFQQFMILMLSDVCFDVIMVIILNFTS